MSSKLHCDLCDDVLTSSAGSYDVKSLSGTVEVHQDLCLPHLNSLNQLLRTWRTQQTGGYINPERDWPQAKVGARA